MATWIKVTERMPRVAGEYYVRFKEHPHKTILHGTPDAFFLNAAMKYTDEGGRPIDIDELDAWLDESTPTVSGSVQEAEEILDRHVYQAGGYFENGKPKDAAEAFKRMMPNVYKACISAMREFVTRLTIDPIKIDACIDWLQDHYERIRHPDYESVSEVMALDTIEILKKVKENHMPQPSSPVVEDEDELMDKIMEIIGDKVEQDSDYSLRGTKEASESIIKLIKPLLAGHAYKGQQGEGEKDKLVEICFEWRQMGKLLADITGIGFFSSPDQFREAWEQKVELLQSQPTCAKNAQVQKESTEVHSALKELVDLKEIKEWLAEYPEDCTPEEREKRLEDYATRKPIAWEKAKKVIADFQSQPVPESVESRYITQDQYKAMAEGLNKPALKLLKNSGVPFEKWTQNIHTLIEKHFGRKDNCL